LIIHSWLYRDQAPRIVLKIKTGRATVTVNPLPTVTIMGTTTVCQNSSAPDITFTGANGTAPYTYIPGKRPFKSTITTTSGNSVSIPVATGVVRTFDYSLLAVQDASAASCSQIQSGAATVTENPLPTATISGTPLFARTHPHQT